MESVQSSINDMKILFTTQLAEFQRSLDKASPSTTVSNLAADYAQFKKFILVSLANLQKQVDYVALECDRLEMRTRRKMVLVHGLPEVSGEETGAVVTDLASARMRVALDPGAISRCHRIGRSVGKKPRPVLVKFTNAADRDRFWFAKTALKASGITVSEFLTKPRHDVFMEARKRLGIAKCWTKNGVIVVSAGDSQHRVTSMEELDKAAPLAQATRAPSPAATGASSGGEGASIARAKRQKK